jgi:hypothetical protein
MALAIRTPPFSTASARHAGLRQVVRNIAAAAVLLACLAPGAGRLLAAEPIATTDGEQSGVRLEVTELKRTSGGTVMLKFTMINEADEEIGFGSHRFGVGNINSDYQSVGAVHLIDAGNKKKYLVIRDSGGECLCSRDVEDIAPGSRAPLWARFPAPPEDVDKISVVVPHFIPLDDVPIGR